VGVFKAARRKKESIYSRKELGKARDVRGKPSSKGLLAKLEEVGRGGLAKTYLKIEGGRERKFWTPGEFFPRKIQAGKGAEGWESVTKYFIPR